MQTLTLPLPPTTNELVNQNRSNKITANQTKQYWQDLIKKYILEQRITPIFGKCFVILEYYFKNPERDYDNLDGCQKMIFDALVKSLILKDDSSKNIWGFKPSFYWQHPEADLVVIHLTPNYDEFLTKHYTLLDQFDSYYRSIINTIDHANLRIETRGKTINGIGLE